MQKSILFVFLDYPPKTGPGALRNYYLNHHFNKLGWKTKVLTISAEINSKTNTDENEVIRAFCKDSTKVFSIFGKYPKFIEIPDRWYLWILPALIKGYKECRKNHYDYIFTGFPSYSCTIVGTILSKLFKRPLVVDLRDPFRFRYDPTNMPAHAVYKWLEQFTFKQTSQLITTTPECAKFYQKLYPALDNKKTHVIYNGFASEFHENLQPLHQKSENLPFILLHSGVLYQIGRNPETLLKAINLLIKRKIIYKGNFMLRFRGANVWPTLTKQISELGLDDYIEFKDRISYAEAINEMRTVGANVLIQNNLFSLQIPSKLYDIIALKSSIIAITNENGALANEMKSLGLNYVSEDVNTTAELIIKLMRSESSPLSEKNLLMRDRFILNKSLSKTLSENLER